MRWRGEIGSIAFEPEAIRTRLRDLERPVAVVRVEGRVGVASGEPAADLPPAGPGLISGRESAADDGPELIAWADRLAPSQLGDPAFRAAHAVELAYASGSMAAGIA